MSESRIVSAASAGGLITEVKSLLSDGWEVKGISSVDADTGVYTQEMIKA